MGWIHNLEGLEQGDCGTNTARFEFVSDVGIPGILCGADQHRTGSALSPHHLTAAATSLANAGGESVRQPAAGVALSRRRMRPV